MDLRQPSNHATIGTIAFPPTPFGPDGQLDVDAVVWDAHRLLDFGFSAVALFGTVGEFYSLSDRDFERVVRALAHETSIKNSLCVGVMHHSATEACHRLDQVATAGIGSALCAPPFYLHDKAIQLSSDEVCAFYRMLSQAAPDVPLLLYNSPQNQRGHSIDEFNRIAEETSAFAVKEGHPDYYVWRQGHHETPLAHLPGSLKYAVAARRDGARGICSVPAAIFPQPSLTLETLTAQQRWAEASALEYRLVSALDALTGHPALAHLSHVMRLKAITQAVGSLRCAGSAPPMSMAAIDAIDAVRRSLHERHGWLVAEARP